MRFQISNFSEISNSIKMNARFDFSDMIPFSDLTANGWESFLMLNLLSLLSVLPPLRKTRQLVHSKRLLRTGMFQK